MMWRNVLIAAGLVAAYGAAGQEVPASVIESEGIATVDTAPSYVEFWLHAAPRGATQAEAMESALRFESALRRELDERGVKPAELVFDPVSIPDVLIKEARVSARLRLSTSVFSSPDMGMKDFAAFCDKIDAMARKLECQPEGPFWGIENTEAIEAMAIGRATEKAYAPAKAAAEILNGQIVAVDQVAVMGVAWNSREKTPAPVPNLRRISCTARVHVVYALTPGEL